MKYPQQLEVSLKHYGSRISVGYFAEVKVLIFHKGRHNISIRISINSTVKVLKNLFFIFQNCKK